MTEDENITFADRPVQVWRRFENEGNAIAPAQLLGVKGPVFEDSHAALAFLRAWDPDVHYVLLPFQAT